MITWTCEVCDVKWLDDNTLESKCWCCGGPGVTLSSLHFTVRTQFQPQEVYNETIAGII